VLIIYIVIAIKYLIEKGREKRIEKRKKKEEKKLKDLDEKKKKCEQREAS
jgi:FtsZ-interacting cell division protein ZipA